MNPRCSEMVIQVEPTPPFPTAQRQSLSRSSLVKASFSRPKQIRWAFAKTTNGASPKIWLSPPQAPLCSLSLSLSPSLPPSLPRAPRAAPAGLGQHRPFKFSSAQAGLFSHSLASSQHGQDVGSINRARSSWIRLYVLYCVVFFYPS